MASNPNHLALGSSLDHDQVSDRFAFVDEIWRQIAISQASDWTLPSNYRQPKSTREISSPNESTWQAMQSRASNHDQIPICCKTTKPTNLSSLSQIDSTAIDGIALYSELFGQPPSQPIWPNIHPFPLPTIQNLVMDQFHRIEQYNQGLEGCESVGKMEKQGGFLLSWLAALFIQRISLLTFYHKQYEQNKQTNQCLPRPYPMYGQPNHSPRSQLASIDKILQSLHNMDYNSFLDERLRSKPSPLLLDSLDVENMMRQTDEWSSFLDRAESYSNSDQVVDDEAWRYDCDSVPTNKIDMIPIEEKLEFQPRGDRLLKLAKTHHLGYWKVSQRIVYEIRSHPTPNGSPTDSMLQLQPTSNINHRRLTLWPNDEDLYNNQIEFYLTWQDDAQPSISKLNIPDFVGTSSPLEATPVEQMDKPTIDTKPTMLLRGRIKLGLVDISNIVGHPISHDQLVDSSLTLEGQQVYHCGARLNQPRLDLTFEWSEYCKTFKRTSGRGKLHFEPMSREWKEDKFPSGNNCSWHMLVLELDFYLGQSNCALHVIYHCKPNFLPVDR